MILFIHTGFSTFVKKDYEMLKKHFAIRSFYYEASKKLWQNFKNQCQLLCWLLINIGRANVIFVWFADYHSLLAIFFAKLLDKKSLLVLAGYDVTSIPEIKYGSFYNPLRAFCASYAIKNADFILPVDQSLATMAKERVKHIKGKMIPIPFGFDPLIWYSNTEKKKIILTVGIIDNYQRLKIKGMDFLIKVSEKLPTYHFIVIGISDQAKKLLYWPQNIDLIEKLPIDKLKPYYSMAKVYVQFSISEGLPNVLCEAMLCECIPVGTRVGGIPTAIGDCGFILEHRDINKAIELIEKAMNAPKSLGQQARQRIVENFPLHQREAKLLSLLK